MADIETMRNFSFTYPNPKSCERDLLSLNLIYHQGTVHQGQLCKEASGHGCIVEQNVLYCSKSAGRINIHPQTTNKTTKTNNK